MKNRMHYVDMARGVAIILVMTGHSILFPACGAIHIPTFFMLAGFVITMESLEETTLKECLQKRVLRLLYPYAFYSLILFMIKTAKDLIGGSFALGKTVRDLFGVVYSSTYIFNREEDKFLCFRIGNEGLWFLTAMICACAVFYVFMYKIYRNKKEIKDIAGISAASTVGLTLISEFFELLPVYLPWGFDIALIGTAFMIFGMIMRQPYNVFEDKKNAAIWTVVAGVGFLILNAINGEANMAIHLYGTNRVLFLFSGMCSSVFIVGICRLLDGIGVLQRVLSYVGRNTLFILAFHTMVFGVFDKIFEIVGIDFPGMWIVRLILTLISCLAGQYIFEKVFRIPRKFL